MIQGAAVMERIMSAHCIGAGGEYSTGEALEKPTPFQRRNVTNYDGRHKIEAYIADPIDDLREQSRCKHRRTGALKSIPTWPAAKALTVLLDAITM